MSPQETLAFEANHNDEFNFFAMEKAFCKFPNDPFKALRLYERYRRQARLRHSA